MLAIEGVLALNHSGVPGLAQILGSLHQGGLYLVVRDGGELNGRVLPAGALMAYRAGGNDHIVAFHLQGNAAAGTYPDKGVHADVVQLLHGDDSGRAADAGGADAHLFAQQCAGISSVFPVALYLYRVVKIGRDLFTPARIAGQEAVPAYVAGAAFDMELKLMLMHGCHLTSPLFDFLL